MLPKIVKVAGIDYVVEEKEKVIIGESSSYIGSCSYENPAIEIKSSLSDVHKDETFVHELFHAILNEAGYNDHDEEMVVRASKVLYQVLKDNKLYFGEQS